MDPTSMHHLQQQGQQQVQQDGITLADAVSNVEVLDDVVLNDDVPCIQATPSSIVYHINYDTNFEDRKAFARCDSRFIEEATVQANMNRMLEEGEQHAINLYTWRCCSRSIPQPKSNEQPNRAEIYEKIVEVLGPEVNKLLAFMYFQTQAKIKFCHEIARLCHSSEPVKTSYIPRQTSMAPILGSMAGQSNQIETSLSTSSMTTLKRGQKSVASEFVSETYLLTLAKFINMFATLDELKNMKSSVKNDYATYRRAAQFLKVLSDSQSLQESQNLSMFLATQNPIRDTLKETLEKIPNYETLMCKIVNLCMQMYEESKFILPSEKHMLVKVIGLSLFLIDGKDCDININKLDSKKRINLATIDKIFKELEMVPLFGDMQIAPFITYVKKMPNFDAQRWPLCSNESITSIQAEIQGFLPKIRHKYVGYISELSRHSNEATTIIKETPRTDAENRELLDLALLGLRLLSDITCHVTELYSWKLMHPTDHHQNHSCPQEAEEYERATRYNYNDDEKSALIELIAMIKGLQVLMNRMETVFIDAIKRSIYAQLQDFIQKDLREPLRKAIMKKDDMIRLFLISVRTCADWLRGVEDPIDQANKSDLSKPAVADFEVRVPRRTVGPSSTQLYMIRTMLESLVSGKAHGDKSTLRKYIDGASFLSFEQFLKDSFYWQYLLNFSQTLTECCDLSQLWYREFYLEMTMGRRIQFPIEMSLPSMLTDHILKTKDSAMMECIAYPLDLYNDSAYCALTKFRKQFLYDEVEAEVNLCFDQFMYKLSEQIFAYYKHLAGSILLDKRFRSEAAAMNIKFTWPQANRYTTLLKQRHFQLLGRTIDLNKLIAQRLQANMLKNLELAIQRFEEGELTDVIELEGLIAVNRYTHKLLSEHVKMDPFDNLLKEANRNVSAPYGRITLHIICELMLTFLPNYCYNSSTNRFVKMPPYAPTLTPHQKGPPRDKLNQSSQQPPYYLYGTKALNIAFSAIHQLYSNFIGPQHFRAIVQLCGYQDVAIILDHLLKVIKSLIQGNIAQYCKTLQGVMPKLCKLPLYDYGSTGVLEYYQAQLKDVIQFPDVKTAMFQAFREMGNAILFCMLIEQSLSLEEVSDLLQAAPFQNILPAPFCKDGERPESKIKRLEHKYESLQVLKNIEQLGTEEQSTLANEGDLLTTERLCCGLTIFDAILEKIKGFLLENREQANVWIGPVDNQPVVIYVDECVEFHRIWSALQFIYCIPVGQGEFTIEQLFGEGLNWAGCVLITLLGQQKRFEALDFCYHLLKVQRVDGKDDIVRGVPLKRMVDRIRRFHVLNSQIFSIINKYIVSNSPEETKLEKVKVFSSPVHPIMDYLSQSVPNANRSAGQPIYMRTAIDMQRPSTKGSDLPQ